MYLLKHPATYLKAQREIDEVLGTRSIEASDISKLKYLTAVLREAVRLQPTVPVLQKEVAPELASGPVLLDGGRYQVLPEDRIILLMSKSQRDPTVWGEDANDFNPDRMLDENFDRISAEHPSAWKVSPPPIVIPRLRTNHISQPFGNGKRACIGRAFAWQESLLVLAMLLQNFDIKLDDPNYNLVVKQALTVKPDNFYVRVTPRKSLDATTIDDRLHSNGMSNGITSPNGVHHANGDVEMTNGSTDPILILYGSNTGTCQAFAQRVAVEAAAHGFKPEIRDMDSATTALPKGVPIVVITSSYEGQPPDNATRFVEWLQSTDGKLLEGVEYTVFGCGHSKCPRLWNQPHN
jgi:cytochrome P450 / NADPH-cytochrome P450 reductase